MINDKKDYIHDSKLPAIPALCSFNSKEDEEPYQRPLEIKKCLLNYTKNTRPSSIRLLLTSKLASKLVRQDLHKSMMFIVTNVN